MLAVDTNVVVRYLTRDNPEQTRRAEALIDGHDIFMSATVLLETEWVLRRGYGFDAPTLARALRSFAGLPHVTIDDAQRVAQALAWMEQGLDFADALHLAGSRSCEAFVTFDKALVRKAKNLEGPELRTP